MARPWRPLLSASWAAPLSPEAEEGEQIICGQADCPWQGSCMMGWKAATLLCGREPHRQPLFPVYYWEFPPLGKGKEPFTFSGKALQPPATRPLESSVKTMAAYWFHLSVPSSTSDVRKWVISVGRFTAAIVGQMLHAKIVVFSRIWPATVCVSSYAPKNNFDF